jgi:hypothetical protein
VTHHPTADNHFNWWLTAWGNWRRLHAVPGDTLTQQEHRDAIDHGEPIVRFTTCGVRIDLAVPGIGARRLMRRCVPCCRLLGIPAGRGTPANEADVLTLDIDVHVPDAFRRAYLNTEIHGTTRSPTQPNARTCPDCGEPYIAEWIDISHCFVGNGTVAVGGLHNPCPARPAP